jgi:predicted PurR-regulated permease PerM
VSTLSILNIRRKIMGKHSAKRNTKKGKILITIIISIILCCIIFGVIIFAKRKNEQKNNMDEQINDTINNLFTALKETNEEEANKYLEYKALIASLDEILVNDDSSKMMNIENELFEDIEWNIESIEVNENEVVAILEVTNKNFINIIKKWMNKVITENEERKNNYK